MGRPKTYRREIVLQKATDLFARKGYEGAHLDELVHVTGLNRFSLYKQFGGKEGLFQAALDGYLVRLGSLEQHLKRDPPGLANLRAFFAETLAHDFPHGCFAVNTIREKHVVPRRVYHRIERFVASSEAAFRRNVQAARDDGDLARTTDVEALAKFLTALNIGMMSYAIVAPDSSDRAKIVGVLDRVLK